MKTYLKNIAIAADQSINAVFGGYPDETMSSRIYRKERAANRGEASKYWKWLRVAVDKLFFLQKNHCEKAHLREQQKAHFPAELK
ncbi:MULTISPECIES: hypothetical protein [Neisseria]|uniref:hypothetical protein n=1 Tax=Neisseria TaxID=482 RepID=UPI00187822C2|nr:MULTISPECIES: hypothetical protein [Neisseria]